MPWVSTGVFSLRDGETWRNRLLRSDESGVCWGVDGFVMETVRPYGVVQLDTRLVDLEGLLSLGDRLLRTESHESRVERG